MGFQIGNAIWAVGEGILKFLKFLGVGKNILDFRWVKGDKKGDLGLKKQSDVFERVGKLC